MSKKLLSILFAASSLLAVSCDKSSDAINGDVEGDALISFVAQKPSLDADTKTAWNSDRKVVTWKAGDKLKVACLRDGEFWQAKSEDAAEGKAKIYTSKPLEEDCDVASFMMNASSIFTWTAKGSYEFYSVYPSNLFSDANFPNAPKAKVTLSPSQHMSNTSFDYDADILVGKSKEAITDVVTEFTVIPMVFKRMVALSQITFKGLKDAEDDEIVKSVTLQAQDDAKLTGPVTLDIFDGTIDGSAAINKVTLKSSNGIALDQSGSITLWFSTLEFTATKLDVTVETDVATYTRSIDLSANAKTFSRDKRNILTINMSGAAREEKLTDQPTEVVFGTLGYESWGETASFSGNTKNQVIQTKDNVQITYTRNGSSLYANNTSIRFYKDNTIKIDAPRGYVITSIEWEGSDFKDDVTTNVKTCSSSTTGLSWEGESSSVIFTRPSGASSYVTLSGVTVTLKKDESSSGTDTPAVSSAIVTTGEVEEVTSSTAVLPAYYTNASALPTEVRFEYGTSSDALTSTAYYNDGGLDYPNGEFSVTVSSLAPGTTYYYRAVVQVGDTDFFGSVRSFSTETVQGNVPKGWLELPASKSGSNLYQGYFGLGKSRNYSYLYDLNMYTALWTAYPLTKSHTTGSASNGSWDYNPNVDANSQINVVSNSYGTNYNAGTYSRGHQLPSADRKDDSTKRKQIYYVTNQTPQIQNGFNGTIWSKLEEGIRNLTSDTDTVYVVTGASFKKVGGNETIKYLSAAKDEVYPKSIPVPNYYWKVVLKVKRNGDTVTSASAIGFWMEHKVYSNNDYTPYAISVDTIEQYTGFDFFANLPDDVEVNAEKNTSWSTFQNF